MSTPLASLRARGWWRYAACLTLARQHGMIAYALQCPAMAEISGQLFGVVLVVAGAIGYLGLVLRRSWAGRGGCSGCHVTKSTADTAVAHGTTPKPEKTGGQTAFFPLENLADIARQRKEERNLNRG